MVYSSDALNAPSLAFSNTSLVRGFMLAPFVALVCGISIVPRLRAGANANRLAPSAALPGLRAGRFLFDWGCGVVHAASLFFLPRAGYPKASEFFGKGH